MANPVSIQQIVAAIRQQMVARTGAAPSRAPAAKAGRTARRLPSGRHQPDLAALIVARLRAIERDDPARGRRAFRIFLESVLIREFGEALINDPAFYDMVDAIHASMDEQPEIAALINAAMAQLLSDPR